MRTALALLPTPEAAHQKASELPFDSELRTGADFARIENAWAGDALARAPQIPDKSARIRLLADVASSPAVVTRTREAATKMLEKETDCKPPPTCPPARPGKPHLREGWPPCDAPGPGRLSAESSDAS